MVSVITQSKLNLIGGYLATMYEKITVGYIDLHLIWQFPPQAVITVATVLVQSVSLCGQREANNCLKSLLNLNWYGQYFGVPFVSKLHFQNMLYNIYYISTTYIRSRRHLLDLDASI